MAGTAGTVIWPSTTARRCNRRPIASRNVDGSNEPGGASFTRLFYMTVLLLTTARTFHMAAVPSCAEGLSSPDRDFPGCDPDEYSQGEATDHQTVGKGCDDSQ